MTLADLFSLPFLLITLLIISIAAIFKVAAVGNNCIRHHVSSEDRPAQDVRTQDTEQTSPSDVIRFESWRAHHLHKILIVMTPGSRDA
jgi:hypothetical protein